MPTPRCNCNWRWTCGQPPPTRWPAPACTRSRCAQPRRLPAWLQALAACLVLTLGAALWLRPPAPEVLRSESPMAQLAPADGAVLESPPAQLRWQAQPGVGRYRVRLYDAQASLLWESAELAQPALALDPGQREHLRPGHYYWRVEWPGGSGLGPYHFEVRP